MFVSLLIVHLLVCFSLILVVLLQSGKGGGLAGAFGGGGGSHALFGGRGAATFLSKATTILGAGFMLTSLGLALLSGAHRGVERQPDSLMRRSQQEAPVAPSPGTQMPGTPLEGAPQGTQPAPGGAPAAAPGQSQAPGDLPGTAPGQSQGAVPAQPQGAAPQNPAPQDPAPPAGR